MSAKNVQPPSPSSGVHFEDVSNDTAGGYGIDAFCPEGQQPILSSTR